MRRAAALALLVLAVVGCVGGEKVDPNNDAIRYWHDDQRGVSCWTAWSNSISCLPDTQVTR